MTAVSQRVSNFLGGISQQADEKLFPGQVKDALNCYPDTTLGMLKRPGGKFQGQLENLTPLTSDNSHWFVVFRNEEERYVASVDSTGTIRVWDLFTGKAQTVTYSSGKENLIKSYLATTAFQQPWSEKNIRTLTINDFTYILNTKKVVEVRPAPSAPKQMQATITVTDVQFATEYSTTIDGTVFTYKTRTDYVTGDPPPEVEPLKLSEVTQGIFDSITSKFKTKDIIDNTIVLTFDKETPVSSAAGVDGKSLRVYQNVVDSFNRLPEQSTNGYTVKVKNSASDKDDFYLKFVADSGSKGVGVWEETRSPSVSPGLKPETMPIALIRQSDGVFKAILLDKSETINTLPLTWEDRLVGDDETNSHPSFVGATIQDLFLFNNRMGFLTEDNVSLSQAGDYYNFYHKTATTLVVSDPIDLSCSSIRPAVLHAVVPIPQGLLLFSRSQQFLMEAEGGAWTPATTTIRTLANYECDPDIHPNDLGNTVSFVSKNDNYTRCFEIFTRGQRESPTVSETTKQVPEWIPSSITRAIGNSQNGLWVGTDYRRNEAYVFRYYEEADERRLASWVKWALPGNVIHTAVQNDVLFMILSDPSGYTITAYPLVLSPTSGGLVNSLNNTVDPALDAWYEIKDTPVFSDGFTKVYIPAFYDTSKDMRYVVGKQRVFSYNGVENKVYSGLTNTITVEQDQAGKFFRIPGDVATSYIYVGYSYEMSLVLPRYMYSNGELGYDFTAYTTTARMNFYTGLGGSVYFKIKDRTRQDWTDMSGIKVADSYEANTSPFRDYYIYTVPVYQRPENYTMKVISDTPFPVSLVAMQWEGQYSSGFYRRT